MATLTDTLDFDSFLPLEQQADPVQRFVHTLVATKAPSVEEKESCSGDLSRVTRQIWELPGAEVLRIYHYANEPCHAACMALRGVSLILRPRLV